MMMLGSLGAVACAGGAVFWFLNQVNSNKSKQARRDPYGDNVQWP
jgi:hypothetical protein